MEFPQTLRQEIVSILNPNDGSSFDKMERCPCCNSVKVSSYFEKHGYPHSICNDCGFVFVNPTPKPDKLNALYEADLYKGIREHIEIPRALRGDDYASLSITKSDALEIIGKVAESGIVAGNWLDIGGGIGSLLNLARKNGLEKWKLSLLEYSSVSSQFARDHFGIHVYDNVEEVKESGQKFDVISAIAVLEHISHPREFLLSAKSLLKENGILIINLPHYPASVVRFKKEYAYFLPPYHLSLFNEKNLCDLLKSIGLEVRATWQNGSPAFVFQYLFPLAERIDAKIPSSNSSELEYFYTPALSSVEKLAYKACSVMNLLTGPWRRRYSDRTFLNVFCVNTGGAN